jgi:hypothetical protein
MPGILALRSAAPKASTSTSTDPSTNAKKGAVP